MLTVTPLSKDRIRLAGSIDGSQDFSVLLSGLPAGATLDCEGVTQINSTGIKSWMRFFCAPDKKDHGIIFENLSIPLVEQLNMFRNFIGGGKVVSMAVPFRCETCNFNFSKFYKIEDVQVFRTQNASSPCTQCRGPAHFDDLPDEYFEFLSR